MLRLSSALMIATLAFADLSYALAKGGSYVHKEPTPIGASVSPPLASLSSVAASESFNGCGGRRVRDPRTRQCRGPADFGH